MPHGTSRTAADRREGGKATASTPTAEQERAILFELRKAGPHGVHSHDLARRLPILNVPERVRRLRKAGWKITSTRERSPLGGRSWGTRYRLEGGAPIALVPTGRRRERGHRSPLERAPDESVAIVIPRAA